MRERLQKIERDLAGGVEALAEGHGTWQAVAELRAEAEALREAIAFTERRAREQAEAAHRARLGAAEGKLAEAVRREGVARLEVTALADAWRLALNSRASAREAAEIEGKLALAKAAGQEAAREALRALVERDRVARGAPTAPPAA